jgi:RNA polymerase sigma-70 factor (ECF subfamily)
MARRQPTPIQAMPETHWSLIARAENGNTMVRREVLTEVLLRYVPALKAHLVYKKRISPDNADDLLQAFIMDKLLENWIIAVADRSRGRFRTFLLTALDNFVASRQRYDTAAIRNPGDLESLYETTPVGQTLSLGDEFDVAWARQLLDRAFEQMKLHCQETGRPDLWEVFHARVLAPLFDNAAPLPYGQLIARLGFDSPGQAASVLVTAKRTFIRILRSLVKEYEMDEAVDEEIADLRAILARYSQRRDLNRRV